MAAVLAAVTGIGVAALTAAPDLRSASPGHGAGAAPQLAGKGSPVVDGPAALDRLRLMLQFRAQALLHHDRAGWLAPIDPVSGVLRARQSVVFDRVTALPVTRWGYEVVTMTAQAPADDAGVYVADDAGADAGADADADAGVYVADVVLTYRLSGDTRDVRRRRSLTVADRAGAWRVVSDTDGTGDLDLWDLGPLTVVRGSRSVAVGVGLSPSAVTALARATDAAAAAVDAVWGTAWPRTVVAVLPRDLAGMAAALGRDNGSGGGRDNGSGGGRDNGSGGRGDSSRDGVGGTGLERLAAVTSGPLGRGDTGPDAVAGAADRIVLNPVAWSELTEVGRRVVLTHEVTHVATRATTTATPPTWLDEGFADYVGYRSSGLPAAQIAGDALTDVRQGQVPGALPSAAQFDPSHGDTSPAYAQAWTACELVARHGGSQALVALYRHAATAPTQGRAQDSDDLRAAAGLRAVLGVSQPTFVGQWRAFLRTLAGGGR